MQQSLIVAATATAMVTLSGCGGVDSTTGTTSTTSTTSSITTTTGSTTPKSFPTTTSWFTTKKPENPSEPLTGDDVAKLMNDEFHAFDSNDPASSYGVFLRATERTTVFCHGGCYQGQADCRVSGSVFNPEVMVNETTGGLSFSFGPKAGYATGYFVNRTEVDTVLGKCAWAYDGGTDNRYNSGCGCRAVGKNLCSDHASAYWNLDPDTGYTTFLNGTSKNVSGCSLDDGGDIGINFYKGPAYYQPGPVSNQMHQMLEWRSKQNNKGLWNEMVLDGEAMLERLSVDPAKVIPAIIYVPSLSPDAKAKAQEMAQDMQETWNLPSPVPIIKVDTTAKVGEGGNPFVFETSNILNV